MSRCSEEYVKKEVISNQLLAALDDKSNVALILSEDDLTILIYALQRLPRHRKAQLMLADIQQLRQAAFGD